MPSGPEWFIVLAVVLVIFGGSQLPQPAPAASTVSAARNPNTPAVARPPP